MRDIYRIYETLRQKGLRVTPQTKIVLDVFSENRNRMLSVGDVLGLISKSGSMDNATVYRNIQKMLDLGVLESMNDEHGINRYTICEREHHHYLICTECGSIIRFPCANNYWEKYAEQNGFAETHHKLEVYGRCAECSRQK